MSSELTHAAIPARLLQLSSPPKQLYVRGADLDELLSRPAVAIVGSRLVTPYGNYVTKKLAAELAKAGVVVISGLALGVDGLAHQATLDADGLTIAVLPGPIEDIAPRSHRQLAEKILAQGGALVSEYPAGSFAAKQNFVARNRLVAGLADAVLITEAALKSGSLHTARFALEQGKEVLAVPGNITSPTSVGCNNLIRAGATPVTCTDDVLAMLKIPATAVRKQVRGANAHEQVVIDLLKAGETDSDLLQHRSGLSITQFNQTLTMLELSGKIRPLGAGHWTLS